MLDQKFNFPAKAAGVFSAFSTNFIIPFYAPEVLNIPIIPDILYTLSTIPPLNYPPLLPTLLTYRIA